VFDRKQFENDKRENANAQDEDENLKKIALDFVIESDKYSYGYQWTWLDMPIIQLPQDILVTQEIIWKNKPDVLIETGIAWGGSIVFYASILQLLGEGNVIAVDKVLPDKNKKEIMKYPFSNRINLIEGSSVEDDVVSQIKSFIKPDDKVMLLLDSNHTHDHVYQELCLYAPLVTKGQYLIVSDTIVEDIPEQSHRPRPWGHGNNPKTALNAYVNESNRFEEDKYINSKLLTTFTPNGYMKCIKD